MADSGGIDETSEVSVQGAGNPKIQDRGFMEDMTTGFMNQAVKQAILMALKQYTGQEEGSLALVSDEVATILAKIVVSQEMGGSVTTTELLTESLSDPNFIKTILGSALSATSNPEDSESTTELKQNLADLVREQMDGEGSSGEAAASATAPADAADDRGPGATCGCCDAFSAIFGGGQSSAPPVSQVIKPDLPPAPKGTWFDN
eukprot:TRINITY_DN7087_c0_g1_i2.p1 TRINITY_DN7087_c0_g1~~TRINITY_DN7087_c0_g1_i2.p1  ORF type:complete len:204 (-),score=48.98 TRINITY_DN7087_c0_g1_i2:215-826(-)